jgi:hypothetical protein
VEQVALDNLMGRELVNPFAVKNYFPFDFNIAGAGPFRVSRSQRTRPVIVRIKVDLPAPLGPTRLTSSPWSTAQADIV